MFLDLMRKHLKPKEVNDTLTKLVEKSPPDFNANDSGKILSVDSDGTLKWTVYESSGGYSTQEVNSGQKWIDGKDIYKKTINLGPLPNSTLVNYPHGIENINNIIKFEGVASNSTGNNVPLPYVDKDSVNSCTQVEINSTNIIIATGANLSMYSGYVTLYYTKSQSNKTKGR